MELPTPLTSAHWLYENLRDPRLRIFDVRWYLDPARKGRAAYQHSHIPGALFADLDAQLSSPRTRRSGRHPWPSVAQMVEFLESHGVSNHDQVVCYDDAGGAVASRLWMILRWLGHERVAVLDGGIPRWENLGLPVTNNPTRSPRRGRFAPSPCEPLLVDLPQARAISEGRAPGLLLDARAPERFRGEIEPVDPRPGHIPGARNRAFAQNLQGDGTLKPPAILAREFNAAPTVHYCGSGVTACHNLLAMEAAGLKGSRLYPGSWSEWSRHEHLPAALGEE